LGYWGERKGKENKERKGTGYRSPFVNGKKYLSRDLTKEKKPGWGGGGYDEQIKRTGKSEEGYP